MGVYRYSGWDGRQDFPDLDKDTLLSELERNLTAFGDLATAGVLNLSFRPAECYNFISVNSL
jgi:hypothetical protein